MTPPSLAALARPADLLDADAHPFEAAQDAVRAVSTACYEVFTFGLEVGALAGLCRADRRVAEPRAVRTLVEVRALLSEAAARLDAADDAGAGDSTELRSALEGAEVDFQASGKVLGLRFGRKVG